MAKSRKVLRTTRFFGKGASRTLSDVTAAASNEWNGGDALRVLSALSFHDAAVDEAVQGEDSDPSVPVPHDGNAMVLGVKGGVLLETLSADPALENTLSAAVLTSEIVGLTVGCHRELMPGLALDLRNIAQPAP